MSVELSLIAWTGLTLIVFVLLAVVAGRLAGRLFIDASREDRSAPAAPKHRT